MSSRIVTQMKCQLDILGLRARRFLLSDVNTLSIGEACLYEGREIKIRSRLVRGSTSSSCRGTLPPRAVVLPTPRFTNTDSGARSSLSCRGADKPEPVRESRFRSAREGEPLGQSVSFIFVIKRLSGRRARLQCGLRVNIFLLIEGTISK